MRREANSVNRREIENRFEIRTSLGGQSREFLFKFKLVRNSKFQKSRVDSGRGLVYAVNKKKVDRNKMDKQ